MGETIDISKVKDVVKFTTTVSIFTIVVIRLYAEAAKELGAILYAKEILPYVLLPAMWILVYFLLEITNFKKARIYVQKKVYYLALFSLLLLSLFYFSLIFQESINQIGSILQNAILYFTLGGSILLSSIAFILAIFFSIFSTINKKF